eukprot:9143267-Pyramimonas_sp.AAC.1
MGGCHREFVGISTALPARKQINAMGGIARAPADHPWPQLGHCKNISYITLWRRGGRRSKGSTSALRDPPSRDNSSSMGPLGPAPRHSPN